MLLLFCYVKNISWGNPAQWMKEEREKGRHTERNTERDCNSDRDKHAYRHNRQRDRNRGKEMTTTLKFVTK